MERASGESLMGLFSPPTHTHTLLRGLCAPLTQLHPSSPSFTQAASGPNIPAIRTSQNVRQGGTSPLHLHVTPPRAFASPREDSLQSLALTLCSNLCFLIEGNEKGKKKKFPEQYISQRCYEILGLISSSGGGKKKPLKTVFVVLFVLLCL